MKHHIILYPILIFILFQTSCSEFLEIGLPVNQQTAESVFSNDEMAEFAVKGIYRQSMASNMTHFTGGLTLFSGLAADEFMLTIQDASYLEFQGNQISASNASVKTMWGKLYNVIYHCNVTIEKLERSADLSDAIRKRLLAEAKFLRALHYFYLVNLYGSVPLTMTSDYNENSQLPQSDYTAVMDFIVTDLESSWGDLPEEYFASERIRANHWAAMALLARVYLYQENWVKAEQFAERIVAAPGYQLVAPEEAFLNSNAEAILQMSMGIPGSYNNYEGFQLTEISSVPRYPVVESLKNLFEPGDRRQTWFQAHLLNDQVYFVAHKYKVRFSNSSSDKKIEHPTILRLGEQYLILAEAQIQQNKLDQGIQSLDAIRRRAGIPLFGHSDVSYTKEELLKLVMLERQRELCFELGHRWFDLNRWGEADAVLGALSYKQWQPEDRFFPIPLSETLLNPSLKQHDNY